MNGIVALALVLAPAAPLPLPPPPNAPAPRVDEFQAQQFAILVSSLAQQVATLYVNKDVTEAQLIEAAIRGL